MSEDIEERFRQVCSAYLAAAEEHDQAMDRAVDAQCAVLAAAGTLSEARDQLLQVVRERDLQAQLGAGETVVYPGPLAAAARDKWLSEHTPPEARVTWMTPQPGSQRWHDMVAAGTCPECGVSWGLVSPDCPKVHFNRHILG